MRILRLMCAAFAVTFVALLAGTQFARMANHPARAAEPADEPSHRIERVLVIGQRIHNLRELLAGYTLRGTEGFVDGSAPEEDDNRTAFPWQVYYAPDGHLEAHFRRIGSRVPHAAMEE